MSHSVLLIAVGHYPLNMAGAHRPAKLAKYLPEFGWTPVMLCARWTPENSDGCYDPVLAAKPDICRTVRVPYPAPSRNKAGRGIAYASEILFPYRAPFGFTRRMLAAAEQLVASEKFDVIWSTWYPGPVHYVASQLARRHGLPWVADFRDIPDQSFSPYRLRYTLKREVQLCRWAKAITTVSQPLADTLARRYQAPVHVVLNGFDPDDYPVGEGVDADKFTICYTGIIYSHRDPRPVFAALDRLAEAGDLDLQDVRVVFYGTPRVQIGPLLEGYRCGGSVECHDRIPFAEVVRCQQRAAVLLSLSTADVAGIMTSKIFNYLAARRPILDVPGGDVTRQLLNETQAGRSAASTAEIAGVLRDWYKEWKRTGTVAYRGIPERVARYSHKGRAEQFAHIFESVAGTSR